MVNDSIVPGFDNEKDESLKIKLQLVPSVDNCLILILNGYIDTYNSSYFQKRVQMAIDGGYNRLIFNCGGLNYVSSTGIGSFTSFLKAVKPRGGDLILLNVQLKVLEVFQLLGFSQFFNIKDDTDEAINFFNSNAETYGNAPFPLIFTCPLCARKLKATKSGKFRCSDCKSILIIDSAAKIVLG